MAEERDIYQDLIQTEQQRQGGHRDGYMKLNPIDPFDDAQYLRHVIDNMPVMIDLIDGQGNFLFCNKMYSIVTGYAPEEILGNISFVEMLLPNTAHRQVLKDEWKHKRYPYHNVKLKLRHKHGVEKTIARFAMPVPFSISSWATLGVSVDITDSENIIADLFLKEKIFENILNHVSVLICRFDSSSGEITYVNDACCQYFGRGRHEMVGSCFDLFIPMLDWDKIKEDLAAVMDKDRPSYTGEHKIITPDGERWSRWTSRPLCNGMGEVVEFVAIGQDRAVRKDEEKEKQKLFTILNQSQKMEAIGTLAGGIAHDFNNILSAILGATELAIINASRGNDVSKYHQQIITASYRAKKLINQILTFSRQGKEERKPILVKAIVEETIKLLTISIPSTVEIRPNLHADNGTIEADPAHIRQVLMNLCTNAYEAMRESGGVLEISLNEVTVGAQDRENGCPLSSGEYLKLTVSDTGHGIAPQLQERIFDPYFSTKEKNEGTGLGLAYAHGIIEKLGGLITVKSELDIGSTFDVYLPRLQTKHEEAAGTAEHTPTGHQEILFVDDEPALAELGKDMLEELGYIVTSRTNSIEALGLFKKRPHKFDMVITDIIMPQMTGDMLAKALLEIRPDIPVILCTGFSELATETRMEEIGVRKLMMKPLLMEDLARCIREIFDTRSGHNAHQT